MTKEKHNEYIQNLNKIVKNAKDDISTSLIGLFTFEKEFRDPDELRKIFLMRAIRDFREYQKQVKELALKMKEEKLVKPD